MVNKVCLCCFIFAVISATLLGCTAEIELQETSPQQFPYQALVRGTKTCSGLLLSKDYVLTPASCVYKARNVTVYLGFKGYPYYTINHVEPDTQILSATDVIIHEDFAKVDQHYLNNIALVKLPSGTVKLNDKIHPGKLISKEEGQWLTDKVVTISGWMLSTNTNMKMAEVQVRNEDTCQFLFGRNLFASQQMCVRWPLLSTHLNLLGNPVSYQGKIVGFQTNTPACVVKTSTCTGNDFVLNLAAFLDWISRHSHINVTTFTENYYHSEELFAKISKLHYELNEVKNKQHKDVEVLTKQLAEVLQLLQQAEMNRTRYSMSLNEQVGDMRSEIRNNQDQFNKDILKLQEELASARTQITNRLSAESVASITLNNKVQQLNVTLLDVLVQIEKLQIVVDGLTNTTGNHSKDIEMLKTTLQEINTKIDIIKHSKPWQHDLEILQGNIKNSSNHLESLFNTAASKWNNDLQNLQLELHECQAKTLAAAEDLTKKIHYESEKFAQTIDDRMNLIEKVVNHNRGDLDKLVIKTHNELTKLTQVQNDIKVTLKKCCDGANYDDIAVE